MIDKNHHYFTNRKYMMNYFCMKLSDGQWGVFEKQKYGDKKLSLEQYGSPLCTGSTVECAIDSAVQMGIPKLDIKVVE